MTRLLVAGAAAVLYAPLLLGAPETAAPGLVGLLLAAGAIVTRWRWPATASACVFLALYAAVLSLGRGPVGLGPALGFGLALVVLLEAVDLSARLRAAVVEGPVVRTMLVRWLGLSAGVVVAAIPAVALAQTLARSLTDAVSPLLAGVGALGSVLVVAILVRRRVGGGGAG